MKTKPISQVNINAATLAGKPSNQYENKAIGFGLFSDNLTGISNADNSDLTSGVYKVIGSNESGMPDNLNYLLIVLATNRFLSFQFAYNYLRKAYTRTYYKGSGTGVWSEWKKIDV